MPVRFVLACDADSNPARFELLEFYEDPGEEQPTWPLAAGLHAPAFTVADMDRAMAALGAADFGRIADLGKGVGRAVSGVAPGEVRFELWEGPAP